MPKVKAVLFDNDGTLVDTYELLLLSYRHATCEVLGRALPDSVLMAKVGQPLAVQMRDFSDDPKVQQDLLETYREYNHAMHDQMISLFPGAKEALSRLRDAGFALGVVTSKMTPLARHGLEVLGIAEYFDCLVGPDTCDKFKPDPEPVRYGCELLGFEPQECVYVGDSPFDIQAGNGAGCTTAAVLWGMFDEQRLAAERPNLICAAYPQLADALVAMKE